MRLDVRTFWRGLLALAYFYVGVTHLRAPEGFVKITPDWVPWPEQVVFWTGVAEILGAIGLMVPQLRKPAAIGLALYAVCVFPANINHALNNIMIGDSILGWGYHGPRLMLQPLIVWWALWAGGVIDWPFRPKGNPAHPPAR